MINIKKYIYLFTSAVVLSCCFSCNNAKPEPQPEPLKESTTTVVAKNVEADDVIKFEYKGEDDFMVDWGDQSTIDEHNTSHTYDGTVTSPVVTITGTFSEIRFADESGPFESNAKAIESVTLGEGITTIPSGAFFSFYSLKSVIIPKSVKTIGKWAFGTSGIAYCRAASKPAGWDDNWYGFVGYYFDYKSLVESDRTNTYAYVVTSKGAVISDYKGQSGVAVDIPPQIDGLDVVGIGPLSFNHDDSVTKITMPDTVEFIGYRAFESSDFLKNVQLSKKLKIIEDDAFSGCQQLPAITFPNSLTKIGEYSFERCAFETITLPDSVESIGSCAFRSCPNLKSITLSNNLTSIGSQAFSFLDKLNEIVIPKSVKRMDQGVFLSCDNLTIYCEAESKPEDWDDDWNPNERPHYFGYIKKDVKNDLEYVACSSGVTILKYKGDSDTSVKIPSDLDGVPVVAIANSAFNGCRAVSISLPDTLKSIGDFVFESCNNLATINLPQGLESIGEAAFVSCSSLEEIYIPKNVKVIDGEAFHGCTNLTIYCKADEQPEEWDHSWNSSQRPCYWGYVTHGSTSAYDYVITNKGALIVKNKNESAATLEIPRVVGGANVISIDKGVFKENTVIKSVKLPRTLTTIASEAFALCTNLETINLTDFIDIDNIPSAEDNAFTSTSCKFKVVSAEMITAFSTKGGGWPAEAERYTL